MVGWMTDWPGAKFQTPHVHANMIFGILISNFKFNEKEPVQTIKSQID